MNEDAAADDTIADDGCPSTKYVYDDLNRVGSIIDALGRTASYQYDAASNPTQRTDGRGLVTKYFYDALNRPDLLEHWNGSTLVDSTDYTYDDVGNRKTLVDASGTSTYDYDALNRPTSILVPGHGTVSYQYDSAGGGGGLPAAYPGQRTKITYPDSKYAIYTYEPDGRMKTVTDWLGKQTAYTHDAGSRLVRTMYPNDVCID